VRDDPLGWKNKARPRFRPVGAAVTGGGSANPEEFDMAKTWVFVAGAGIGYVLGTRAGREKYNAMRAQAREFLDKPTVRETTDTVQAEAARLYEEGRHLLRDRLRQLRLRTDSTVGRTSAFDTGRAGAADRPVARPPVNGVELE
jgi:hypothetical protein